MMPYVDSIVCNHSTCHVSFKNHRWGATKAHGAGWFVQKNGTAYCPIHVPEWVKEWRNTKSGGTADATS